MIDPKLQDIDINLNEFQVTGIEEAIARLIFDSVLTEAEYEIWRKDKGNQGNIVRINRHGHIYRENHRWQPTKNHRDWWRVEAVMVKTEWNTSRRHHYIQSLFKMIRPGMNNIPSNFSTSMVFEIVTAPLPMRCIAFLKAMGRDIGEILKE